ncbi:MAG: autotransporter-associated beta strand repeat-containing protein, partial [Planctomycetota bacterium]|nr:autotransporter-associated beta strand repeat-containing protein [Planctomycetota bacterium]
MNGSIIGAAGVLSAGAYDVRKGTISGNLGGSGDVIKTTADTVTLSGANSYTGPTVVLEGTLAVSGATLGTADAGTTVAAGAVIQVSGTVSNEPLTLYGNGISGTGAMRSGNQSSTWTGPVTLGADTVMGSDLWNTLAISGSIGDNGAGRSLTKVGTGWLTLTGTNTYGGATIVAGGMLQASDGVGLSAASNLVLAGGMYGCDTASPFTRSLGTQPGQVQWTGSGGFAAWNGKMTVNLGGNMTPDTLTWGANGFIPDGCELRLSTTSSYDTEIQNPIDLGGAARTVRVGLSDGGGGGLATLSGSLSNGGLTKVGPGTLVLKAHNTYTGPTTLSGGFLRVGQADAIPASSAVSVAGSNSTFDIGAFAVNSGPLTLIDGWVIGTGGVLTATSFEVRKGTISTSLAGSGGLTKTTTDYAELRGANTYTGTTLVAAGTLAVYNAGALGKTDSGTTVLSGATLSLSANVTGESLSIGGYGLNGTGALAGSGTWAGPVTMTAPFSIANRASSQSLTVSGPIGDGGNGYGLTIGVGSSVTLSGPNTYTGATTIAGTLYLGADNVFADNAPIVICESNDDDAGTLDIRTFRDTVGLVTLASGMIAGSGGVLTSNAGFQVSNGYVRANLGGSGGLVKTTADTVQVTGANTYAGATTVAEGVLNITNANALGSTAAGTTVQTGGALELYNSDDYNTLTMAAEPLTLNGQGVRGNGALRQTGHTAVWTGAVTLGDNAVIGVDSSRECMTISGAVGDAGLGRGFTKVGAAYLALTGSATYTGPTIISQGTVRVIPSTSMSSGNLVFNGGLLQTTGTYTFSRALGGGPGQVQWTGSGGFGAIDGPLTVNIGGHATPDTLVWGSQYFVPDGSELLFTSVDTDYNPYGPNYTTEILNPIDFAGKNRSIRTGSSSNGAVAVLSGALTNGGLTKNGVGCLVLKSPANSLFTIDVNNGTLRAAANGVLGANTDVAVTYDGVAGSYPGLDIGTFNQTVRSVRIDNGYIYGTSPGVLTTDNYNIHSGVVTAILAGTGGLTKSTSGNAALSGANIYRGVTRVLEGTLSVKHNGLLGSSLEGTVVSDGATLALDTYDGAVTVPDEPLTLYGAGVSGNGALMSWGLGGATAWNGPITLGTDVTIGSWDSCTLTINGVISGPYAMTVKSFYEAKVVLTAANQYTGPTHIKTNGQLRITNSLALGPSATDVTVDANAKLQMDGNITFSGRTLVLNGGGIETLNGTGAWNGPIQMTAASSFNATSGTLNIFGSIDDGGSQSGVSIGGSSGGVLFNTTNHYTGTTRLFSLLRATEGVGLPTASNLLFSDGVFEAIGGGTFTRSLGTGTGQVQWEYSRRGGFSASGGKLTVAIGGLADPTPLRWNTTNFLSDQYTLKFGSATADSEVEFRNPLDLAGGYQGIAVEDNPASAFDFATVSGVISNGSLNKLGYGLLRLTATNTYTGYTIPVAGALRAVDGVGLPTASNLKFTNTSPGGVLEGEGPTLMLRGLGTGPGQVQWTGSGGFAAKDGKLTVALGGTAAPTALVWDAGGFVPTGSNLQLGYDIDANSEVDFRNAINLGAANRTFDIYDNPSSPGDFVTLSGAITGTGGLVKVNNGLLRLTQAAQYTGLTYVNAGTLKYTMNDQF